MNPQPWQSKPILLSLKDSTKVSQADLSVPIMGFWAMWLSSATNYMVIHLAISLRTKVNKVEIPLPTQLLLLGYESSPFPFEMERLQYIVGISSKMIHAQKMDTSFKMLTPHLTGVQRT